jgi:hypothetical protein
LYISLDENKLNIWKDLAIKIDGKFVEGIAWHSDHTEVSYKDFNLIFDNFTMWSGKYNQAFTRVRFSYISEQDFVFKIYRNGIVRTLEKLIGAQDVKIGFDEFDRAFIIKSNDNYKIFDLLKVEALRNLIEVQEDVNIEVSKNKGVWGDALPENEFELCFYSEKIINDVDKLEKIYELFIVIINRLLEMKVIKQRPKR